MLLEGSRKKPHAPDLMTCDSCLSTWLTFYLCTVCRVLHALYMKQFIENVSLSKQALCCQRIWKGSHFLLEQVLYSLVNVPMWTCATVPYFCIVPLTFFTYCLSLNVKSQRHHGQNSRNMPHFNSSQQFKSCIWLHMLKCIICLGHKMHTLSAFKF